MKLNLYIGDLFRLQCSLTIYCVFNVHSRFLEAIIGKLKSSEMNTQKIKTIQFLINQKLYLHLRNHLAIGNGKDNSLSKK